MHHRNEGKKLKVVIQEWVVKSTIPQQENDDVESTGKAYKTTC